MKLLFLILLISACSEQAITKNEKFYQKRWCQAHGGQLEVTVREKNRRYRIDCLTSKYAVEVDFAGKWEAVAQALHYGRLTGKKPAIVFICRAPNDRAKIKRTLKNIRYYGLPIKVWRMNC